MKYYTEKISDGTVYAEDENGNKAEIEISMISGKIRAGCVVVFENGSYSVSEEETAERKKAMFSLQNKLFSKKKNNG